MRNSPGEQVFYEVVLYVDPQLSQHAAVCCVLSDTPKRFCAL